MAVTKNHPINSTLKKAIEYICSPHKAGDIPMVYSYGCLPQTADIEFLWTQNNAREKSDKGHLARHLIQSFEPGETTPEQAYEIGLKFAEKVLGGKYEFVFATHIDRGHIHNHIIFNDVNFIDYHRSHINRKWYYNTRKISDRICKKYGLSVIENPSKNKGKSYKERTVINKGISWKQKLQFAIDDVITKSKDWDDFVRLMEQNGYAVKKQNKNISFLADGRERYMRSKTLGEDYTLEAIIERIEGKRIISKGIHKDDKRIGLLIDIQNCIKAQESRGYEHWAKIHNIKQLSKTLNFISDNGIETYEELENLEMNIARDFGRQSERIKEVEGKIKTTSLLIKNVEIYMQLKPIYDKYKKAKNKVQFRDEHFAEITLFEKAIAELKSAEYPQIRALRSDYKSLSIEKEKLYSEYKNLKKKVNEIHTIKTNIDSILGASHRKEPQKSTLIN